MTSLCGTVRSYWQFFLYRMGVGVGEATLSPCAYSMITDVFPRKHLGKAISAYSLGIYFGAAASGLGGAFILDMVRDLGTVDLPLVGVVHSWQLLFLTVGLLGLIPLVIFVITVREPVRREATLTTDAQGRSVVVQTPLRKNSGLYAR